MPNKIEKVNLRVFNTIKGINESMTSIHKTYLMKCRFKFNGKKCYSKQKWNNDKYQCESKNKIMFIILVLVLASVARIVTLVNT